MNDDILMELARNVPAAFVGLLMVILFLRHIKAQERNAAERSERAAEECHDVTRGATAALLKHAEAGASLASAMHAQNGTMQQLVVAITRCPGFMPGPPEEG